MRVACTTRVLTCACTCLFACCEDTCVTECYHTNSQANFSVAYVCSYIDAIMSGKVLIAYGAQYTNVPYVYIISNSKGHFVLYYLASH